MVFIEVNTDLKERVSELGFQKEDVHFIDEMNNSSSFNQRISSILDNSFSNGADAVFINNQLEITQPLVYFIDKIKSDNINKVELLNLQNFYFFKEKAPLLVVFYKTSTQIIDCRFLARSYDEIIFLKQNNISDFALKLKSGVLWEENKLIGINECKYELFQDLILTLKLNIPSKRFSIQLISVLFYSQYIKTGREDINIILYGINIGDLSVLTQQENYKILTDFLFETTGEVIFEYSPSSKKYISLVEKISFNRWMMVGMNVERFIEVLENFYEEDTLFKVHPVSLKVKRQMINATFNSFANPIDFDSFKVLDFACNSADFLSIVLEQMVDFWKLYNQPKVLNIVDLNKILSSLFGTFPDSKNRAMIQFCIKTKAFGLLCDTSLLDFNQINYSIDNLSNSGFLNFSTKLKFDLIVGNPLFIDRSNDGFNDIWETKWLTVKVPPGHISLNYLARTFQRLVPAGTTAIVLNADDVFYQQPSSDFNQILLLKHNLFKVLNYTLLKSLSGNRHIPLIGILARNEKPDCCMNFSHYVFKENEPNRNGFSVDADSYDLHFINKQNEVRDPLIWKKDALGGGVIRTLFDKIETNLSKVEQSKNIPSQESKAWSQFYNEVSNLGFSENVLAKIQTLVETSVFSKSEVEVLKDIFDSYFIDSKNDKSFQVITSLDIKPIALRFSEIFLYQVNALYGSGENQFRLMQVCVINDSFVGIIYKYCSAEVQPKFDADFQTDFLPKLNGFDFYNALKNDKIARLYPSHDTMVLIKPKIFRYWNALAAFNDSNKYFM